MEECKGKKGHCPAASLLAAMLFKHPMLSPSFRDILSNNYFFEDYRGTRASLLLECEATFQLG